MSLKNYGLWWRDPETGCLIDKDAFSKDEAEAMLPQVIQAKPIHKTAEKYLEKQTRPSGCVLVEIGAIEIEEITSFYVHISTLYETHERLVTLPFRKTEDPFCQK